MPFICSTDEENNSHENATNQIEWIHVSKTNFHHFFFLCSNFRKYYSSNSHFYFCIILTQINTAYITKKEQLNDESPLSAASSSGTRNAPMPNFQHLLAGLQVRCEFVKCPLSNVCIVGMRRTFVCPYTDDTRIIIIHFITHGKARGKFPFFWFIYT